MKYITIPESEYNALVAKAELSLEEKHRLALEKAIERIGSALKMYFNDRRSINLSIDALKKWYEGIGWFPRLFVERPSAIMSPVAQLINDDYNWGQYLSEEAKRKLIEDILEGK